jgi:hypothetical protein
MRLCRTALPGRIAKRVTPPSYRIHTSYSTALACETLEMPKIIQLYPLNGIEREERLHLFLLKVLENLLTLYRLDVVIVC